MCVSPFRRAEAFSVDVDDVKVHVENRDGITGFRIMFPRRKYIYDHSERDENGDLVHVYKPELGTDGEQ